MKIDTQSATQAGVHGNAEAHQPATSGMAAGAAASASSMSATAHAGFDWHPHFIALVDAIEASRLQGETTLCSLAAEQSEFIRFNAAQVRQIGTVSQGRLTVRLIAGARHAYSTLTLSGDRQADLAEVDEAVKVLRSALQDSHDDPHLLFDTTTWAQSLRRHGQLPDPAHLVATVTARAHGLDFVGFYAGGTIVRGFASSTGSRGWHQTDTFNFSWSLYDPSGRAIKTTYAGDQWSDAVFAGKLADAAARLPVLKLAPRALAPGRYRAYLSPQALDELLSVLNWTGGFSARQQATSSSTLYKLHTGERQLDPRVHLTEDLSLGVAAGFNDDGYVRRNVTLVDAGRSVEQLTSARTAREYGLSTNGATSDEAPSSLSMRGGDLPDSEILAAIGTGLYIGNLWYVNVSDPMNARLTGMTRFATFWVEDGKIVAPIEAMRFDDSIYRILGDELERLTQAPELVLNDASYGERGTGGHKLPGLLLRGFALTL